MPVLGYLAKLKSGLGLALDVHFLHDLLIKMFFISPSMDKVSMSQFLSQDIKQNLLLSCYLNI